jgi:hypothetical protein
MELKALVHVVRANRTLGIIGARRALTALMNGALYGGFFGSAAQ